MSHDKIKAAARRRMAATGEPYVAARRQAISEYNADQVTWAVSAEDIRAAAEVHRELGPDYSDAVVASFIDKVDKALAARAETRRADRARPKSAKPARLRQRSLARRVVRDALAASAGALVVLGAVGLHEITRAHPAPPVNRLAVGTCESTVSSRRCLVLPPNLPATFELRTFVVIQDGRIITLVPGLSPVHR